VKRSFLILFLLVVGVLFENATLVTALSSFTLYPVADSYADSKYPTMAYGARTTFLFVGNKYDRAQDIWGSERIYIRFNLTELGKDREIVKASVRLWQYDAPKSSQIYEAHRVLSEWNETVLSWVNQPSWASSETSEAVSPPQTEVPIEWDITSDLKAWYSGEAPNYGTIIKVAEEKQVDDASSGFWSREYPVGLHEERRPSLVVVAQGEPKIVYGVTISVAGLPTGKSANVTVDGRPYGSSSTGNDIKIAFNQGTTHVLGVIGILRGAPGVRYVCNINQTRVSNATSHLFSFATEYSVNITTSPRNMFETPQSGWYRSGTSLPILRTGGDVIYVAQGTRLVYDAWYLGDKRMSNELTAIIVNEPVNLEARYATEYYLNVTSPFGVTNGSGWYKKDVIASFSVDINTLSTPGILGVMGLKKSFYMWIGSQNLLGVPRGTQGSIAMRQPSTITAVWRDHWDLLVTSVLVVLVIAAITGTILIGLRKRTRSRGLPMPRRNEKVQAQKW
jgi:hypothetical protein